MTQQQTKALWYNSAWLDLLCLILGAGIGISPVGAALTSNTTVRGADELTIYAALVGLQGSLLGFVLAALAIIAGYSQNERMQILRDAGQLPNLLGIYLAATRSYAASTLLSLIALLIGATADWRSAIAVLIGTSVLLASIRLLLVLRVTKTVLIALH